MASGKHFLKEDGHCQVSGDVAHTSDLVLRENGRCIPLSMSTIRTSSSSFVVIIIVLYQIWEVPRATCTDLTSDRSFGGTHVEVQMGDGRGTHPADCKAFNPV